MAFGSRVHILAVSADEAFVGRLRDRFAICLGGATCALARARSMEEARARLRARQFDLALVDVGPPGGPGLEALDALRREFPALPAVALADGEDERAAQAALSHGAAGAGTKCAALGARIGLLAPCALWKAKQLTALRRAHSRLSLLRGLARGMDACAQALAAAPASRR